MLPGQRGLAGISHHPSLAMPLSGCQLPQPHFPAFKGHGQLVSAARDQRLFRSCMFLPLPAHHHLGEDGPVHAPPPAPSQPCSSARRPQVCEQRAASGALHGRVRYGSAGQCWPRAPAEALVLLGCLQANVPLLSAVFRMNKVLFLILFYGFSLSCLIASKCNQVGHLRYCRHGDSILGKALLASARA